MTRDRRPSQQTLAVLGALLAQVRLWQHGYQIAEATGLKSGTLYPVLMRLADRGWLDSKWQPPQTTGRPPRHLYRLNAQGIAAARELTTGAELPARAQRSGA